jgi:inner membrane protein
VFAANAADLDFIPGLLVGDVNRYHQSLSHSFLFALLFGFFSLVFFHGREGSVTQILATRFLLYGSHLLIDYSSQDGSTPLGIPLLWPVSNRHFISPWPIFYGVRHGVPGEDFSALPGHLCSWENVRALSSEMMVLVPVLLFAWYLSAHGSRKSSDTALHGEEPWTTTAPARRAPQLDGQGAFQMKNSSQDRSRDLDNEVYFDRWAKSYDDGRLSRWFHYTQRLAIGVLDLKPGSKVLDIGCGTGFAVLQLASMLSHGRACGIDISPEMIRQAWAKVPETLRERIEFRQASSESIPYSAGEFDYVLCTNSFHHYSDPLQALREMARVLKPGGQIAILENASDLSWYTWVWDHILRIIENGHIRYYSSHEIGVMLKQTGFECPKLCYLRNELFKHGKVFASIQVWNGQKPVETEGN